MLYNWAEWLKEQEQLWQGAPPLPQQQQQLELADSLAAGLLLGSDDDQELDERLAAVPEAAEVGARRGRPAGRPASRVAAAAALALGQPQGRAAGPAAGRRGPWHRAGTHSPVKPRPGGPRAAPPQARVRELGGLTDEEAADVAEVLHRIISAEPLTERKSTFQVGGACLPGLPAPWRTHSGAARRPRPLTAAAPRPRRRTWRR